ncbi:MAG TPA: mandelate racemase/muconate lactonizing enzyme family protein [Acetobacteraceae bacterium]|nr:mandelate racemase/muconate lactonizing enzyme family protein [Acetobacteraceae bacterium]
MKITRLLTKTVQVPFRKPILSALGELRSADSVLIFIETDAGLVGEGLSMALNGVRLSVLVEMARSLEPLILGLDPTLDGSFRTRAWRELNFFGTQGVSAMGIAGIDMALWDLRGKAAGLNVARLLGACRTEVPAYASGGLWLSASIDELQREAEAFLQQGFRAMKMRLGKPSHDEDVARVRAVREAIGPDVPLMADANQHMTVTNAIRLGRRLEEFGLAWFEEPIRYDDHAGEAAIAAALDTPLASGETEYTSRGMLRMLEARSADILMPDLQRMGGPTEFLKAGHIAEAYAIPVSSHLYSEMSLPLLATLPNALILEHMPWFEELYGARIELDGNGHAKLPDRPGWGFSFDQAAVRRLAG